jgi:formate dehydrogenase maturation protein FdhE
MDYDAAVARAEELARRHPRAAELLFFVRAALRFQKDLQHRVKTRPNPDPQRLDTALLAGYFPDYLQLVRTYGPKALAERAQKFEDRQDWEGILRACWQQSRERLEVIARAVLQPYVRHLSERWYSEVGGLTEGTGTCPFCSRPPLAATHGVKRLLHCSLCSHEWGFPEKTCPACRSERVGTVRHRAFPYLRAEGCEDCGRYLKSADLGKDPGTVLEVDEAASTELDEAAEEKGWAKLELNLAGR